MASCSNPFQSEHYWYIPDHILVRTKDCSRPNSHWGQKSCVGVSEDVSLSRGDGCPNQTRVNPLLSVCDPVKFYRRILLWKLRSWAVVILAGADMSRRKGLSGCSRPLGKWAHEETWEKRDVGVAESVTVFTNRLSVCLTLPGRITKTKNCRSWKCLPTSFPLSFE